MIVYGIISCLLYGCGESTAIETAEADEGTDAMVVVSSDTVTDELVESPEKSNDIKGAIAEEENTDGLERLVFRDVFGEEYETEIRPDIPANKYNNDHFRHERGMLYYDDDDAYD